MFCHFLNSNYLVLFELVLRFWLINFTSEKNIRLLQINARNMVGLLSTLHKFRQHCILIKWVYNLNSYLYKISTFARGSISTTLNLHITNIQFALIKCNGQVIFKWRLRGPIKKIITIAQIILFYQNFFLKTEWDQYIIKFHFLSEFILFMF